MNGAAIATKIAFEIDDLPVEALPGESILEAADRYGIEIPRLCYRPGLRADGNCRACVVEVDGERVLAASCCRAPSQGMKVKAASERARRSQRMVLELLMSDTPAGGHNEDSELRQWAETLAVPGDRFASREQPPVDFSHPAIAVQLDACIQCGRCVRACREEQANDVIGYAWRGGEAQIVFDQGDPMGDSTCVACGECVQVCPTGALLPRRLEAREAGGAASAPAAPGAAEVQREVVAQPDGQAPAIAVTCEQPVAIAAQGGQPAVAVRSGERSIAVAGSEAQPATVARPRPQQTDVVAGPGERSVDSLCPFCGVGCQLTWQIEGNRIVRTDGRDGPANRGRLCVKGRFGFDYIAHPQRLTVPLVRLPDAPKRTDFGRVPANWREQFREASWDEALALAGGGLARIRDTHGSQALAGFGSAKGSNEEAYLFQKLVRTGFGSNNVDHCTRLCHASSVAALLEGIGSGAVSNQIADVLEAELIFVIGANPTVNHPVAATWIKNAARRGATLVIADPRRTELARHATHVLQFRPDSDVSLLNAMLHVIIAEGLVDETFVRERTHDFEALREQVAQCSPEAMAPLCGIDAATIRTVARAYARSRGSMILWGMGVSQHVHGTDNARCLIALALVTGQIGRPGTGLHPLRGQNNVQGASDAGLIPMMLPDYQRVADGQAAHPFEQAWGVTLDREPGLTVVEVVDAALAGRIRGMYIMGENPAMSDPDLNHARAALAKLELLVVQDIFPTETAMLADVILPASAFPEKTGSFTNTDRMVQLARQALEPPGHARQDLAIIVEMARQLGLDWSYTHPSEVFEEMRQLMPSIRGISWERLEREGSVTYPCPDEASPGQPVVFTERFPTNDGRARLVPAQLLPAAERVDPDWPMVLITGRQLEHWHTGAMTRRASVLDAIEPKPTASLNPRELRRLGVAAGELIEVASRRGAIVLTARSDEGVAEGCVFIPFAYAEAAANLLTHPALDPYGKIPGFKHCAVRVAPASASVRAPGSASTSSSASTSASTPAPPGSRREQGTEDKIDQKTGIHA